MEKQKTKKRIEIMLKLARRHLNEYTHDNHRTHGRAARLGNVTVETLFSPGKHGERLALCSSPIHAAINRSGLRLETRMRGSSGNLSNASSHTENQSVLVQAVRMTA